MVKSAYIHIPFCKSKCNYCAFVSYNKLELKKNYIKSVEKEINRYYKGERLDTVYFGGGTPSNLTCEEFENILQHFNTDKNTEITVEINPESADYAYLRSLYDIGINRISIGCQSFDDMILKIINRRHNSTQAKNAIQTARNAGFKNISADFIYGLPEQTFDSFLQDLQCVNDIGVEHISLYGLTIEEGTKFYKKVPKNIADEEGQAQMYYGADELLATLGYEHYEISNFSKSGYNSKHNCAYWKNQEYYGFGTASHGYVNGIRYSNSTSLEEYINNPTEHKTEHLLSQNEKLEEEIFLGLRLMSGINIHEINEKYNIDFDSKYKKIIKKYLKNNLLIKTNDGYAFTTTGALLSNYVLADFIED